MLKDTDYLNLRAVQDLLEQNGIRKVMLTKADVMLVTGMSRETVNKRFGGAFEDNFISVGELAKRLQRS